ncbi:pyruvate dehydrogenase phosphatase regulatory subunit, mitochondrial-like isoform X2 [Actinia tenebrosa]|uniref:Pyruvate dehydrogenase phosphatase regulatory subunit, mitochondrial-like isoform X2 n=1 Tax=Actinia tenebrosa TaxID=6105 RepID=A0A6P8IGJ5_ACTTE|nr:pyruvate dehydrogenase phosphatase regulatory subunit, mitochondrial-like isoform X2 [Actinia tenebrosa]
MYRSGLKNVTPFRSSSLRNKFLPVLSRISPLFPTPLSRQQTTKNSLHTDAGLPSKAEIVICGGGIIGCSVAYHLSKLGWNDIILLEQGSLTCGTTWHAVGLIGKMRATSSETALSNYGTELYQKLEEETGLATGFKTCGGMYVARTEERMTLLKRNEAKCRMFGIQAELLTPQKCQDLWPVELRIDDLQGGLWIPEEGAANPTDISQSLARGAIMNGVKIYEKVTLDSVITEGGIVQGVATDKGDINCSIFINCAGQWARDVGLKSNPVVNIPLHSCEHFYVVTKDVPGVHSLLPNLRDPDGHIYFREWSGGLMIGGFEPESKPCFHDGIPKNFEFQLLPEDWDHFEVLLNEILHRVPIIENVEIRQLINGPESFTPDGRYILGEAPEVRNYFVAAGMCSSGIASAAGVGKALSEWITEGHPTLDIWPVDIKRFSRHDNNKRFLRDRVKETLGWHYTLRFPYTENQYARKVKTSPLYSQLDAAGAVWGEKMGWERANWFSLPEEVQSSKSPFGKPSFFRNVQMEVKACHENVALVDMTSMGIFEISSFHEKSCEQFLQLLCAKDVDIPVGGVVQTALLNKEGCYVMECTVARTDKNSYLIIIPTAFTQAAHFWISRHIPKNSTLTLRDVQSSYVVLGVLGPKSDQLLQSLTRTPLNKEDYPINTFKTLEVVYATDAKALRRTNVGDLEKGWQLFIPTQFAHGLYDHMMTAGKPFGITNAGCYCVDSLRIEKGYPRMGIELTSFVTPYEAGLENRIDLQKETDFIGKEALQRLEGKPLNKRLIFMALEEHDSNNIPWGGEPVFRNGKIVGSVSSASLSFVLNKPVCMGYVKNTEEPITDEYIRNGNFEVDVAGQRFPVKAALHRFKEQSTENFLNKVFI